jgi:phosphoglycolate phosphatase
VLILFDLDLTLLRSTGAGLAAMEEAGERVFGRPITRNGLDTAGRLDPLIFADLLELNGLDPTPGNIADLRGAYAEAFPRHAEGLVEALPGTHDLLGRLAGLAPGHGLTLGVLTGNFPETGKLKLRFGGFDLDMFAVRVWGDASPHDPPHRDHLPPVGIGQYESLHGRLPPETVIVGDTPHDVRCALRNGCRVLAVATGRTDAPTLTEAGAHRVVESLEDTEDLVRWLLGG